MFYNKSVICENFGDASLKLGRAYIYGHKKKQPAHPAHLARENVSTQREAILLLQQSGVGGVWDSSCKVLATCGIK